MCVDFVEAKTGIRSLVSLVEEMDVFGGEIFRESATCSQKFWGYSFKNWKGPHAFHPMFENGFTRILKMTILAVLSRPVGTTPWIVQY